MVRLSIFPSTSWPKAPFDYKNEAETKVDVLIIFMYGAKVWGARQEDTSMRRDWNETGSRPSAQSAPSRRGHNYAFAFPGITSS